jgi:hypothetical protein
MYNGQLAYGFINSNSKFCYVQFHFGYSTCSGRARHAICTCHCFETYASGSEAWLAPKVHSFNGAKMSLLGPTFSNIFLPKKARKLNGGGGGKISLFKIQSQIACAHLDIFYASLKIKIARKLTSVSGVKFYFITAQYTVLFIMR